MSAPRAARTLVIDESLNPRLASELASRGRDATTLDALGLRGSRDSQLLDALGARLEDWVLVTADDALPDGQADAIRRVRATVAVVAAEREAGWRLDPWRREVVHRWAHAIQTQPRASVRRYSLRDGGPWHPRRRRPHD